MFLYLDFLPHVLLALPLEVFFLFVSTKNVLQSQSVNAKVMKKKKTNKQTGMANDKVKLLRGASVALINHTFS